MKLVPVIIEFFLKHKDIGWLYYVNWEGVPIIDYLLRKRMFPDIEVTVMFVEF